MSLCHSLPYLAFSLPVTVIFQTVPVTEALAAMMQHNEGVSVSELFPESVDLVSPEAAPKAEGQADNMEVDDSFEPRGSPSPGDDAASSRMSDTQWAEPEPMQGSDVVNAAKADIMAAMSEIANTYGGPYQYLSAQLQLVSDDKPNNNPKHRIALRNKFAQDLVAFFPENETTVYHHETKVPQLANDEDMANQLPHCFHISALGYDAPLCSMKDPPGKDLFLKLVDLYVTDGFKTANEPLLVNQPDELAHLGLTAVLCEGILHPLGTASLGYVKGLARSLTVLCMAHWVMEHMEKLAESHPVLHQSMCQVYGHHMYMENQVEATLKNMKISCAGSVRKPPNVIGMVSMCHKLVKKGLSDYQEFGRRWNATAPKQHKLMGQKATSMKLLFTAAPTEVLDAIIEHVAKLGWEQSVYTDDNLTSKKLYPGSSFIARGKKWQARLKVTGQSMALWADYLHARHEETPKYMQKKLPLAEMCEFAERAAAVYAVGQEFLTMLPLKPCVIKWGLLFCTISKWLHIFFRTCIARLLAVRTSILTYCCHDIVSAFLPGSAVPDHHKLFLLVVCVRYS